MPTPYSTMVRMISIDGSASRPNDFGHRRDQAGGDHRDDADGDHRQQRGERAAVDDQQQHDDQDQGRGADDDERVVERVLVVGVHRDVAGDLPFAARCWRAPGRWRRGSRSIAAVSVGSCGLSPRPTVTSWTSLFGETACGAGDGAGDLRDAGRGDRLGELADRGLVGVGQLTAVGALDHDGRGGAVGLAERALRDLRRADRLVAARQEVCLVLRGHPETARTRPRRRRPPPRRRSPTTACRRRTALTVRTSLPPTCRTVDEIVRRARYPARAGYPRRTVLRAG